MFRGSIVAIVTPFHEDKSIHFEELERLLNWHVEEGTDGIVILGTTGEASTLTEAEKIQVFETTVRVINGRIPVIAGTGSNNTMQTIAFSRKVASLGVDALLVVTPYYNKSNSEGYYQHFSMIASSVDIPVILYNVPSRTGGNIPVDVVARLSSHPNIIGIKEASGDMSYTTHVASVIPKDFLLFSGNDDQVLPILALGGVGVISVAANIIPKQFHDMVAFYEQYKFEEARAIQLGYLEFIHTLFIETNPIPIKECMNQAGHQVGGYRLPLYNMSEPNKQIMINAMKKVTI